jgi:heme/copper-type cytochrome/quinol oxidase subunit 2
VTVIAVEFAGGFATWAVQPAPAPILPQTSDVNWPSLLFALALLTLFVAAVAALVVVWLRRSPASRNAGGAEAILASRFASGELDEAEFERRRSVLRS